MTKRNDATSKQYSSTTFTQMIRDGEHCFEKVSKSLLGGGKETYVDYITVFRHNDLLFQRH